MAKYTVTIRELLTNNFDFGLKDYPIFDESHREVLNNMILNHYMMSEIGQETPALFKLYLNNTMNEIMPKYNILYRAIDEFAKRQSVLANVDMTTETNSITENNSATIGNNISTGKNTGKVRNINLDTPQGQLSMQDLEGTVYATTAQMGNSEDNNTAETNSTNKTDSDSVTTGKQHTYGNSGVLPLDVMMKIQDGILNVDESIIKELQPLFFGLY